MKYKPHKNWLYLVQIMDFSPYLAAIYCILCEKIHTSPY
jgi:hypothetical protein